MADYQLGLCRGFWAMTHTPTHPFGSHFLVPASSHQKSPDPTSSGHNNIHF